MGVAEEKNNMEKSHKKSVSNLCEHFFSTVNAFSDLNLDMEETQALQHNSVDIYSLNS